jgi:hypothetical protein
LCGYREGSEPGSGLKLHSTNKAMTRSLYWIYWVLANQYWLTLSAETGISVIRSRYRTTTSEDIYIDTLSLLYSMSSLVVVEKT